MPILGRARVVPREVIERVVLSRDDKVLAAAPLDDGSWLVATVTSLHRVPRPDLTGHASPQNRANPASTTADGASAPALGDSAEGAPAPAAAPSWRRDWTDVDRASLDSDSRTLAVRWTTGQGEERYQLADSASRTFTRTVNERITASVVASRELKVPGGRVRIAVRRRPDGSLLSQVLTLGAVDAADPQIAKQIDDVEGQLREISGLD